MFTGIIDIHAHEGLNRLQAARAAGIAAVIIKSSQGKDWPDPGFPSHLKEARKAGMLVGAYHFGSASSDGNVQADYFLSVVAPWLTHPKLGGPAVLALDWENNPNPQHGTMTREQAVAFVKRIHERTGVWPLLYSGASFLREHLGRGKDSMLANCPLWLAAYGPDPKSLKPQATWERWKLQQYSNGADGPADQTTFPRKTPGFGKDGAPGGCDRSAFDGPEEQFRAWWEMQAVHTVNPA